MDLNNEIDAVVARLSAGEDPRPILTAFAKTVRGAGRVVVERDVFKCMNCRCVDALCFKCKALAMVGEQGVAAAPALLEKLGPMLSAWSAERKARKEKGCTGGYCDENGYCEGHKAELEARRRTQQSQRRPPGHERF